MKHERLFIFILMVVAVFLISIGKARAFDSSQAYNVVTMSYPANQMIYNRIVLDNMQKAETTMTFSVDVKNGGGRPTHDLNGVPQAYATQTDSAYIRIRMYDTGGALVNTVTSQTYTLKNWGSNPGGWSAAPGDNLQPWSTASVTYSGSLANIWFVQIEMVGTDGAYWAGNYGPEWRVPTVTIGSDPTNVVYNPEFGVSPNSVKAQGWFNSSNSWATCGTTSGNTPCVTAVNGVTANEFGGGYDANGGSLAGATGGYNGTLTTSTADTAAATGSTTVSAPAGPTVDGGTITATNWSGSEVITSGSTSTAGATSSQQTRIDTWTNNSVNNNLITVDQVGHNNQVNFTQDGNKNKIEFTMNGNNNVITGTQTGSNYLKEEVPGWGNNITTVQTNTVGTNFAETKIQGNGNTVNHTQTGNANKVLFSTVTGDINTLNTTQTGDGGHFLETKLTGNFNNVTVNQSGNTANKANIDVTNAGGPATVDLQQTGGKNFTIIQSCVNSAGCSTVVRQ